jgi:hypothetical protein
MNNKKVVICGSIYHFDKIKELQQKLAERGFLVETPPTEVENGQGVKIPVEEYYNIRKSGDNSEWVWDLKTRLIRDYFEKIKNCDAVLIANYEKNGIAGYIGSNTLMEMAIAFFLGKKIFIVNKISSELSCLEEIKGMKPIFLNSDLDLINL